MVLEIMELFDFEKDIYFDYHIPFLSIPHILGVNTDDMFVHHDDGYIKSKSCKNKLL